MTDNSNERQLQTPASKLQPKTQYVTLLMNAFDTLSKIAASPEPPDLSRVRISMHTQMMISFIPNPEERKRLRTYRDEEEGKILKKENDSKKVLERMFRVDCDIVGMIMELSDDILGINERQVILETVPQTELELKYYPNGYEMGLNDGIEVTADVEDDEGEL